MESYRVGVGGGGGVVLGGARGEGGGERGRRGTDILARSSHSPNWTDIRV